MSRINPDQLNQFFTDFLIDNNTSVPTIDLPDAAIQAFGAPVDQWGDISQVANKFIKRNV